MSYYYKDIRKFQTAYDHSCDGVRSKHKRKLPKIVDMQQIRNLRHIDCKKCVVGNLFASCCHCLSKSGQFTNERIVEGYLKHVVEVPNLSEYPDHSTRRLEAMAVEYQKPNSKEIDPAIIHAAYNTHRSTHVKGCFKSNDKKRKKISSKDYECRQHLPEPPRKTTCFDKTEPKEFYLWTGESYKHEIHGLKNPAQPI